MEIESATPRTGLSRDFAILTALILTLLFLLGAWMTLDTHRQHSQRLLQQMQTEATRMDQVMSREIEQASYLLESMARQVLQIGPQNKESIASLLRSFDERQTSLNLFAWADSEQLIQISSEQGVYGKGVDISDRDYIKKSISQPWEIQIGRPVKGRISGKEVIPLSLGVTDYKGNYVGAMLASIELSALSKMLQKAHQLKSLDFAVITDGLMLVVEESEIPDLMGVVFKTDELLSEQAGGTISQNLKPLVMDDYPAYWQRSASNPYIFLLGFDLANQRGEFFSELGQRLLPLALFIVFLSAVLWIIRNRLLDPLYLLQGKLSVLLQGKEIKLSHESMLSEVSMLDRALVKVSDYIAERRRIEHEQKSKMALMKKAKEAAEISNRVKLNFMNAMSHELRIPLNTISGFSELMRNEVYGEIGNKHYQQYVEDIYQSTVLLQSLISDVIALGKAESEMLELHEKPVRVQQVTSKCIRVLTERLKESGITVENRVSEQLPRLRVDETRLKQIILNLLTNSISHTPSGGSIVIDAQVAKDAHDLPQFEIVITDYGAKRLPDRVATDSSAQTVSEQLDEEGKPYPRTRSEIGQTSNLGVPLTKALVAMHQGELEIQSPPGKATRVIVRFAKDRIVE